MGKEEKEMISFGGIFLLFFSPEEGEKVRY
jgi:hypothetical protein